MSGVHQPQLLERGDLVFPLESLAPFLRRPGYSLLLSEDITQPSARLAAFMDRASLQPEGQILLTFFNDGSCEEIPFRSGHDIASAFERDRGYLYSSDFYFETATASMFGYSSARDTLAVIAVAKDLVADTATLVHWDRGFAEGAVSYVGFGEEGRTYARQLLTELPEPRSSHLLAWPSVLDSRLGGNDSGRGGV